MQSCRPNSIKSSQSLSWNISRTPIRSKRELCSCYVRVQLQKTNKILLQKYPNTIKVSKYEKFTKTKSMDLLFSIQLQKFVLFYTCNLYNIFLYTYTLLFKKEVIFNFSYLMYYKSSQKQCSRNMLYFNTNFLEK